MKKRNTTFCTSFYAEKTSIEIIANNLIIKEMPSDKSFDEIMVFMSNEKGSSYGKKYLKRTNSLYDKYILPKVSSGIYYLCIYRKSLEKENEFWGYITGVDIPIVYESGMFYFPDSGVLEHNKQFLQSIIVDDASLRTYKKPSYAVQSYDADIKNKANEITRFSHTASQIFPAVTNLTMTVLLSLTDWQEKRKSRSPR